MSDVIPTVKQFILDNYLPGEDPQSLTPTTSLITSGILDSLATLGLVSFLESKYGIEFEANEVDVSRLGTLNDIARIVDAKLASGASGA